MELICEEFHSNTSSRAWTVDAARKHEDTGKTKGLVADRGPATVRVSALRNNQPGRLAG